MEYENENNVTSIVKNVPRIVKNGLELLIQFQFSKPETLHQSALVLIVTPMHQLLEERKKEREIMKEELYNAELNNESKKRRDFVCKNATDYEIESYNLLSPTIVWEDLVDLNQVV